MVTFRTVLRRKLNMEKRGFFGYKHVNSLHVKLEIGLIIIYVISSCYYMFKFENAKMAYVMFTYLGISWTLRAWMEWKYDRKSKEYILSITGMVFYIDALDTILFRSTCCIIKNLIINNEITNK